MQAQIGTQYEANDSGNKYEVVAVNEHEFDVDMTEVELEPVDEGEWHTQYLDNFKSGYTKVVGGELSDEDKAEIKDRAGESWTALAREFNVTEDTIQNAIFA